MQHETREILIVGAGPAGLIAARHLRKEFDDVVVFESRSGVGGIWNSRKNTTPIYLNLQTNLPKEIMPFNTEEDPFKDDLPSFLKRHHVQDYLQSFSKKYKLEEIIQFNSKVKEITPQDNQKARWKVVVDQKGDRELVTYAQYVVICTGQYEAGHSPRIKGLENFQGEVMHSKDYKKPNSSFKDKVILCVGCGSSGFDIANELACTVAKKVLLSCKDPSFAPNLTNHPKIQRLPVISHIDFEGKINCGNEFEAISVDVIIFCTGYLMHFPFLNKNCGIKLLHEDRVVSPLFMHIFNIVHPSMAFIGVPVKILPFPIFDLQARAICEAFQNRVPLPSQNEMKKHLEEEGLVRQNEFNLTPEQFHYMSSLLQWHYYKNLTEFFGFSKPPPYLEKIYGDCVQMRFFAKKPLDYYRSAQYVVEGSQFKRIDPLIVRWVATKGVENPAEIWLSVECVQSSISFYRYFLGLQLDGFLAIGEDDSPTVCRFVCQSDCGSSVILQNVQQKSERSHKCLQVFSKAREKSEMEVYFARYSIPFKNPEENVWTFQDPSQNSIELYFDE